MEKTIHGRMAKIKAILSETKINKSGHNKFAGFKYHELTDFLNIINKLNLEHGVNDIINIDKTNNECKLTLVSFDNNEDSYSISIPYSDAEMLGKGGSASMVDAVQRLGSTVTYIRRYLYMTAYNIQENDGVDSVDNTQPKTVNTPKAQPKLKTMTTDVFYGQFEKAVINGKKPIAEFRKIVLEAGFEITAEQEELIKQHK